MMVNSAVMLSDETMTVGEKNRLYFCQYKICLLGNERKIYIFWNLKCL